MAKTIDYFMAIGSPWSYLGHDRFVALARKHGVAVNLRVIDLAKVFPVSGGLPLPKRAPQRQAYRLVELKRWQQRLGIPFNPMPKFFPIKGDPSALLTIAALEERGVDAGLGLAGALMRAGWAEEKNLGEPATIKTVAAAQGLDAESLYAKSIAAPTQATYDRYTQEAIDANVFGAPWYVYDGEPFWGQDRLEFLERALAASRT